MYFQPTGHAEKKPKPKMKPKRYRIIKRYFVRWNPTLKISNLCLVVRFIQCCQRARNVLLIVTIFLKREGLEARIFLTAETKHHHVVQYLFSSEWLSHSFIISMWLKFEFEVWSYLRLSYRDEFPELYQSCLTPISVRE